MIFFKRFYERFFGTDKGDVIGGDEMTYGQSRGDHDDADRDDEEEEVALKECAETETFLFLCLCVFCRGSRCGCVLCGGFLDDSVFRSLLVRDNYVVAGIPFRSPKKGRNIVYTSLWDNYPDSVTIPLKGSASTAYLLMAGSTNHMQSRIDNGLVIVTYQDNTTDTMALRNPDNWCPIEQDYYIDGKAFTATMPRPYRVCLGTGTVSRDLGEALGLKGADGRYIPGGAAQLLTMPLNPQKKLKSLTVRTLSNDVVIGLMGVTLQ